MLAWLKEIDKLIPGVSPSIAQHTYSRGFITERVLCDFWTGLSRFLGSSSSTAKFTSEALLESLVASGSSKHLPPVSTGADLDHTDEFMKTLHALDDFTRAASISEAKPVKEMYKDWFFQGKELVNWWTTLVRDLDLVEDIHNAGKDLPLESTLLHPASYVFISLRK